MANDIERFFHWLRVGAPKGSVFEARIMPRLSNGGKGAIRVGFYGDPAKASKAIWWWAQGRAQTYAGLNPRRSDIATVGVNPERLSKTTPPHEMATTDPVIRAGSGEDVAATLNILVDFDPERPVEAKHEAATNEEVELAHQQALLADEWLREQGFRPALVDFSGNGYHLILKVPPQVPSDFEPHLQAFLHEMHARFGTPQVKVDCAVYDAVRICKVPGSISVKGSNTGVRPWRPAKILRWVDPVPDQTLADYILSLEPIAETERQDGDGQPRETIRLGDAKRRPRVELDYALKRCAFLQHCQSDAKKLPEPEWHAMITNVLACEGGEEVAHDLSRPYIGYSESETDAKIRHVLRSAPGPHACTTIAGLGWVCPYLSTCPARAPASLAVRDAPRSTDALDMADETKVATLAGVADEIRALLSDTAPPDDEARARLVARVTRSLVGEAGWSLWMALDALGFSPLGSDRPRTVIRMWAVGGLADEAKAVQVPATPDIAGAEALLGDLPGHYLARLLEGDEAERVGVLIDVVQAGAPPATVLGAALLGDGGADDYRTAVAILNAQKGAESNVASQA